MRMWAYSASFGFTSGVGNIISLGGDGFFCECAVGYGTSRIQTAHAGAQTVTLIPTPVSVFGISLSNGNLTAELTTAVAATGPGPQIVYSDNSYSSGKYYFEATVTALTGSGQLAIGVADGIWSRGAQPMNTSAFLQDNGGLYLNGSGTPSVRLPALSQGSIVDVAVDFGGQRIWFRVNGGKWNGSSTADPATGSGGISISSLTLQQYVAAYFTGATTTNMWTLNFGSGPYSYPMPSGFGDWDGTLNSQVPGPPFAVGDWLNVNGLCTQQGGNPANWQYNEYHKITAINGDVLTLDSPLANSYLSTWPDCQNDGAAEYSTDGGGPASVALMSPSWNVDLEIFGGNFLADATGAYQPEGRTVVLRDAFVDGYQPTTLQTHEVYKSILNTTQVDKDISLLDIENSSFPFSRKQLGLMAISASVQHLKLVSDSGIVQAGARDDEVNGGTYPYFYVGASHGVVDSITVNDATISNAAQLFGARIAIRDLYFNSSTGVLSISNDNQAGSWRWGVPGHTYFFADAQGNNDSLPRSYFTISSMTQDSTNTYYSLSDCSWRNNGSCTGQPLPTPTCGKSRCTLFFPFASQTIAQTGSGPADLKQLAAP